MTRWTPGEKALTAAAVRAAPSVHNTQPWVLEFRDGSASVLERFEVSLPRHDPTGRDRLISCGTALTNLLLAVRVLGWDAEFLLFPDLSRPDEVARVVTGERRRPSDVDLARYAAIPRRHSHRHPFAATPVPQPLCHELVEASTAGGVQVRPIRGIEESTVVAGLLAHTGLVLRDDRGYQRELSAWTSPHRDIRPEEGISAQSLDYASLPWAGLVRSTTRLPGVTVLAARVHRETLLLLETPDDGRRDHVLAGHAMQQVWLAATHADLVGSVLTQPLHLSEVRAGLIEQLGLAGFPQALMRFGHPVDAIPGPRRHPADPSRHDGEESTP